MHHISIHDSRGKVLPHILEVHWGNAPQKVVPPGLGLVSQAIGPNKDSLITRMKVEEDATWVESVAVTIARAGALTAVAGAL